LIFLIGEKGNFLEKRIKTNKNPVNSPSEFFRTNNQKLHKKMNRILIIMTLVAVIFAACMNNQPASSPVAVSVALAWRTMKMKQKICVSPKDTNRCAEINLSIPQAEDAANAAAATSMNDTLKKYAILSMSISDKEPASDIEKASENFMAEYERFAKENKDASMGFSVDIDGKSLFTSSKITSVELTNYTFAGGAHPNHATNLFTFDRKTGKTIGAKDLFTDAAIVAKLLEKPFCELKKDEKGVVPAMKDLLLEGKFGLPANIAVVKEGVRFYYNPYEYTAYAVGDFDLLLTWAQLGGLIKKEAFLD
jgi:Deacetylase PdaC/Protein of unknown function (DUF3298)